MSLPCKNYRSFTTVKEIRVPPPAIITDSKHNRKYRLGKKLGIGAYSTCYEVEDIETKKMFGCKVVYRKLLTNAPQRENLAYEIVIHRDMDHQYILKLHSYFEDDLHLYIILDLCTNGSLQNLQKSRGFLTEPEVRYFMRQILLGLMHIHSKNVIHRDIKIGNILIDGDMNLKIGDFGLATTIQVLGARKYTSCGTPNYISPEIVSRAGHSYEADVWAAGVIMYILLLGQAPFERKNLPQLYEAIVKLAYKIPPGKISPEAESLLTRIFVSNPFERPTIVDILNSDFMKEYIPRSLPTALLTQAPLWVQPETKTTESITDTETAHPVKRRRSHI